MGRVLRRGLHPRSFEWHDTHCCIVLMNAAWPLQIQLFSFILRVENPSVHIIDRVLLAIKCQKCHYKRIS